MLLAVSRSILTLIQTLDSTVNKNQRSSYSKSSQALTLNQDRQIRRRISFQQQTLQDTTQIELECPTSLNFQRSFQEIKDHRLPKTILTLCQLSRTQFSAKAADLSTVLIVTCCLEIILALFCLASDRFLKIK